MALGAFNELLGFGNTMNGKRKKKGSLLTPQAGQASTMLTEGMGPESTLLTANAFSRRRKQLQPMYG